MIRKSLFFLVFFVFATTAAFTQETINVRAGEHSTYSRLVMQVPSDDWELTQSERRATFRVNGWAGNFTFGEVFDRIPRTRLLSLSDEKGEENTTLKLSLSCDCEVRAQILGGLVVLDISDTSTEETASRGEEITPVPNDQVVLQEPMQRPDPNNAGNDVYEETVGVTAEKPLEPTESSGFKDVAPEESGALAKWLADRLETAADQGFINLDARAEETAQAAVGESPDEQGPVSSSGEEENSAVEPTVIESLEEIVSSLEKVDQLENLTEQLRGALTDVLDDDVRRSMRVRVPQGPKESVLNPSNNQSVSVDSKSKEPDCIDEHHLFAPDWIGEGSISKQISELRGQLVAEFDRPNAAAAKKLTLLYLANGMGLEARALISDLGLGFEGAELYLEIAEIVEGSPLPSDSLLKKPNGCKGRVLLWRTVAEESSKTTAVLEFDKLVDYFSELPLELRRVVGPKLVRSLFSRNQSDLARRIFSLVDRAAGKHGPEHELLRARFFELDGRFLDAKTAYAKLIVGNSPVAADAMIALVSGMLDREEPIADELLEQLESEAFRTRNLPKGEVLRTLEILSRAESQSLDSAFSVLREMIKKSPEQRATYFATASRLLIEKASSEGSDQFAKAVFSHWDLISDERISFRAALAVGETLTDLGLANTANDYMSLFSEVEDPQSSRLDIQIARALKVENQPIGALEIAQKRSNNTAELAGIAAGSLLLEDRHGEAFDYAMQVGLAEDEVSRFAWRAGHWDLAQTSSLEHISTLASFMKSRGQDSSENSGVLEAREILPSIEETERTFDSAQNTRQAIEAALSGF